MLAQVTIDADATVPSRFDQIRVYRTRADQAAGLLEPTPFTVDPTVGGTVNVGAGGVLLGADLATFSAVLGEPLMTWLATHNHGTGVGPSTPPIIPPPPTILSQSIKLKL